MGIHSIQTAEFRQQLLGGLGSDTADAGNIVGGIPHQGFQVNQLLRLKTVFLPEPFLGIQGRRGLARLGNYQLDVDIFVNQLQRIPVAGDDNALPSLI